MSIIPLELVESILNYLLHDLSSLQSCALTNRSWLPSVRRRLFHTKSLDPNTDYDSFVVVLRASPGIADSVRCLKLSAPPRSSRTFPHPTIAARDDWIVGMARLCMKFVNVECLLLNNFAFQLMDSDKLRELLKSLTYILSSTTKLSLSDITFARADEIRRFIRAFPHINDLALIATSDAYFTSVLPTSPYDVLPSKGDGPRLRNLKIVHCSGNIVKPLIQASIFDLDCFTYWTTLGYGVDALFEAVVSESLEVLELGSFGIDLPSYQALAQFPRKLSGLKTFAAHIDFAQLRGQGSHVEWLYQALSNLPFNTSEIRIQIKTDREEYQIDWDRVDRIIECGGFGCLYSVTETVELQNGDNEMIQKIKEEN